MSDSETRQRTKRFRAALAHARPHLGVLADEAGYAPQTFELYDNRRAPSQAATLALAHALEKRAKKMQNHVRRLREVCNHEEDL